MARKDFDIYYTNVTRQYLELNKALETISDEVAKNIVPIERLKALEDTIIPVRESYKLVSYIKYLLDSPNRKNKKERYANSNKKMLSKCKGCTSDDVIHRNRTIIDKVKSTKEI